MKIPSITLIYPHDKYLISTRQIYIHIKPHNCSYLRILTHIHIYSRSPLDGLREKLSKMINITLNRTIRQYRQYSINNISSIVRNLTSNIDKSLHGDGKEVSKEGENCENRGKN